ncbi:60 kDa chaperonin, partial [Chlamydia psittaci 06-1683]
RKYQKTNRRQHF